MLPRYSRYGPGASLARHIDERHEELKGVRGWRESGRRSVSWLVYLNENWRPDDGGALRCFERAARPASRVGATANGDLQVGWLKGPTERPVFLDARARVDALRLRPFFELRGDLSSRDQVEYTLGDAPLRSNGTERSSS